jgi:organic hydroperoxide reductase OsmC/OhrA
MPAEHTYRLSLRWTGDRGTGTSGHRSYDRDHEVLAAGKPVIAGSSDPAFRGDPRRWNPEELLVAALSQCHMLWYLSLAAANGVVVTAYADAPTGIMVEEADGGGRFSRVVLRPAVTVAEAGMLTLATGLHDEAHRRCFIANSVNFPVLHEPETAAGTRPALPGAGTPGISP